MNNMNLVFVCAFFFIFSSFCVHCATVENFGYHTGMFSYCPGVTSKVVITPKSMREFQVILHTQIPSTKQNSKYEVYRRRLRIQEAAKTLSRDKKINFNDGNKRTVVYVTGFLDASSFPHTRALAEAYAGRGYNVLLLEINFFTTRTYPKAARLSRELGRYGGQFLAELSELTGLKSENIELSGLSMGGQIISYIAEEYSRLRDGQLVSRMVALDPAGPCYRSLPPDVRLRKGLANETLVVHTNIDGFGTPEPLGDVDIYVNGGEWQPSDIPDIPCLVICSHLRAIIYWIIAIENPNKFIAVQCTDVQQARNSACLDNEPRVINTLGLETNFSKKGIFYLPTWNTYPYYQGRSGLRSDRQVFSFYLRNFNSEDVLVV